MRFKACSVGEATLPPRRGCFASLEAAWGHKMPLLRGGCDGSVSLPGIPLVRWERFDIPPEPTLCREQRSDRRQGRQSAQQIGAQRRPLTVGGSGGARFGL